MIEYAADAISRVALVTTPRATDRYARGYRKEIVDLARFANRYCLTMWGLLASFLFIYGGNLCRIWINREFGDWAAILLPLFLGGYTLWMSQFVSAAVLMGIARYTAFSLTLFGESIVSIGCMAVILPRYGLPAAVGALAVTMAASRFVILSYLFTREFELSQLEFLWSIFRGPGLLMGCSVGALWLCREYLVPGRTWFQLISIGDLACADLYSARLPVCARQGAPGFRIAKGAIQMGQFPCPIDGWSLICAPNFNSTIPGSS